jgi:hypothetical protein
MGAAQSKMSTNDALIVALVTVIHIATFAVMIWIRFRRTPGDGLPNGGARVESCVLCGEPATGWSYDGLDPDQQRDPNTGRIWSADMAHYRPVCAAHELPQPSPAV